MNIFLVDDDAALLEAFTIILNEEGHHVTSYTTSTTIIADSIKHPPALYLIDVQLNGVMNGEALVKALKQEPSLANIPIIVMSGVADIELKAQQLGVEYLPKPSSIDTVLQKIEQLTTK